MTQALEQQTFTPEEYLELEVNSDERHEYINQEIISMAGGTPAHNEIASILNAALRVKLKGKPYSIFVADQRLWIPERNIYTYPDVMVVEKPLQLQAGRNDTIINPVMIAEVLSQSTQDYDRGEKFVAYRTIDSFREYLLIDQYRIYVEHYLKTAANQWLLTEYHDSAAKISLNTFECEIHIADIYEGIDFSKL